MAKKVTRKQLLKEPDEFITTFGKTVRLATAYKKHIGIAFAVAIVAGLAFGLLSVLKNRAEDQAFALLAQANQKYQSSLDANKDPKKALEDAKGDFENIVKEYSGYKGGQVARVEFANYCYEGGEYDRAAELFKKALDDFGGDPSYRNFILSGLGYSHEAKKDYEASARYFEMISGSDSRILKDEALFNLGRIYAELGNSEKSVAAYDKLASDYPDSIYIDLIKDQLKG